MPTDEINATEHHFTLVNQQSLYLPIPNPKILQKRGFACY